MQSDAGAPPHVVIVGAGFGGLNAARALARAPVRVTVLDRNNCHLFQPLLYQVPGRVGNALAVADHDAPAPHPSAPAEYRAVPERGNRDRRERPPGPAHDRALPYDYLIVASGSGPGYFGHDDWARLAPPLKSIEDSLLIRRKIRLSFEAAEVEPDDAWRRALLTFVLVGAGPTGVEMAGAIAEIARATLAPEYRHVDPRSARIVLLEGAARILNGFPRTWRRRRARSWRG